MTILSQANIYNGEKRVKHNIVRIAEPNYILDTLELIKVSK